MNAKAIVASAVIILLASAATADELSGNADAVPRGGHGVPSVESVIAPPIDVPRDRYGDFPATLSRQIILLALSRVETDCGSAEVRTRPRPVIDSLGTNPALADALLNIVYTEVALGSHGVAIAIQALGELRRDSSLSTVYDDAEKIAAHFVDGRDLDEDIVPQAIRGHANTIRIAVVHAVATSTSRDAKSILAKARLDVAPSVRLLAQSIKVP